MYLTWQGQVGVIYSVCILKFDMWLLGRHISMGMWKVMSSHSTHTFIINSHMYMHNLYLSNLSQTSRRDLWVISFVFCYPPSANGAPLLNINSVSPMQARLSHPSVPVRHMLSNITNHFPMKRKQQGSRAPNHCSNLAISVRAVPCIAALCIVVL